MELLFDRRYIHMRVYNYMYVYVYGDVETAIDKHVVSGTGRRTADPVRR
jgi:hypothetical protein